MRLFSTNFAVYKHLLPLLLVAGCGRDNDNDGPAPAPQAAPVEEPTETPADVPTVALPTSLAINSLAELPTCDAARNQQLVYVLDAKQFQTCQAGAWVVVEIQAPAPVAPGVDLNRLRNAILTIQPGQTLETMLPETKEYLLSLGEHIVINASVFDILVKSEYDAALPCKYAYYYSVKFINNAVDNAYDGCAD